MVIEGNPGRVGGRRDGPDRHEAGRSGYERCEPAEMGMKRALVLNAGSSSLKWSVLDAASEAVVEEGDRRWDELSPERHAAEMRALVASLPPFDAAGHRVVHGGSAFTEAVRVDAQVKTAIQELAELAPLHNPAALGGIKAVEAAFPALPQVAAFDTAFHHTIPPKAATYPLPRDWTDRWSLRRYGFHGLSVQYAVRRSRELLGDLPERLVVCHLGAGCSVTAVRGGLSVDTSMGFTPLEGVMMAGRSGSVDPGLLLYLINDQQVSPTDLDITLNQRSGLLGVSGVSGDLRQVIAAAEGNDQASLALAMFVHSLVRAVGMMIGVLGGLDAIVFTGGIGEHSALIRGEVADGMGYAGLRVDPAANAAQSGDGEITAAGSAARALVIGAREDLSVLAGMRRVLGP